MSREQVNEAQPVPQRDMVRRQKKGFPGKLPQNGTLQVVTNLVLAVYTTKKTGPQYLFMHTISGGPSTPNSLKPTHSEEGLSANEKIRNDKPVMLRNNRATKFNSQWLARIHIYIYICIYSVYGWSYVLSSHHAILSSKN